MSIIRFTNAQEVFDLFPAARDDIEAPPTDAGPLDYLERLAAGPTPNDAISFCAYLLPRREAVWWACRCMRALVPARTDDEDAALQMAEAWVEETEESRRRAALRLGMDGDKTMAAIWTALAAGWSGGSLAPDSEAVIPIQPHMTARACRAAVLIALGPVPRKERQAKIRACLDSAIQIAKGEIEYPQSQQRTQIHLAK